MFLLPQGSYLAMAYSSDGINMDEKELTAAYWTYRNGTSSGRDTDTLSTAALKYYALRTPNGVVGVMGIGAEQRERVRRLEQERLLNAFANQIAVAIERIEFWNQICKVRDVLVPGSGRP